MLSLGRICNLLHAWMNLKPSEWSFTDSIQIMIYLGQLYHFLTSTQHKLNTNFACNTAVTNKQPSYLLEKMHKKIKRDRDRK